VDPVHTGHLRGALEAREELGLDSVLFIPAASPPHKPGLHVTSYEHRREMLRLSIRGHASFELSDIEHRLPGKSYTVNTLKALHAELGSPLELFFITGLDGFLEVHSWWRYMDLFKLTAFAILKRPGYNEDAVEGYLRERVSAFYERSEPGVFRHPTLHPVHCLDNTMLAISSTRIRELARRGRSVEYLVLPEVMQYIASNGLYSGEGYTPDENHSGFRHGKAHGEHESGN
jgi:nicotinate-nucleotide adenylyltransferase